MFSMQCQQIVNYHCGQVHLLGNLRCSESANTSIAGFLFLLLLLLWQLTPLQSLIAVCVNVEDISVDDETCFMLLSLSPLIN